MNTAPERAEGTRVSLALACAQCEAFWGASWYFNPRRWATVDGYVPFPVLWDSWRTMQSVEALRRLHVMHAVSLAHPVTEDRLTERLRSVDREQQQAFPAEA